MNSRERALAAIDHAPVDPLPTDIWATVESQRILPFGAPDEVRAEVRHCMDALAGDGTGYILAPCHNLQAVTPTEAISAMYNEAGNYGSVAP